MSCHSSVAIVTLPRAVTWVLPPPQSKCYVQVESAVWLSLIRVTTSTRLRPHVPQFNLSKAVTAMLPPGSCVVAHLLTLRLCSLARQGTRSTPAMVKDPCAIRVRRPERSLLACLSASPANHSVSQLHKPDSASRRARLLASSGSARTHGSASPSRFKKLTKASGGLCMPIRCTGVSTTNS